MSIFNISLFNANRDNYVYVITNTKTNKHIIFDPTDAHETLANLENLGGEVSEIFLTHRHHDHVDAVEDVKAIFPQAVVHGGSALELDIVEKHLQDNQEIEILDGLTLKTILTPGHTLDCASYLVSFDDDDSQFLFTGDSLFSMGCGGMFDGRILDEYWNSLKKIKALDDEVYIFASHEYTLANLAFILAIDPDNKKLQEFHAEILQKTQEGIPTYPTTLKIEKEFNVFLRCDDPEFKKLLGYDDTKSDVDIFGLVRHKKSHFILQ